jgi:hypothetical protein
LQINTTVARASHLVFAVSKQLNSENGANIVDLDWLSDNMFVLPVLFSRYHKAMLAHTKMVVESYGRLPINPRFNNLITSLRTAVENSEGSLDKGATSFDDTLVVSELTPTGAGK